MLCEIFIGRKYTLARDDCPIGTGIQDLKISCRDDVEVVHDQIGID
jgi:hypothetical protein